MINRKGGENKLDRYGKCDEYSLAELIYGIKTLVEPGVKEKELEFDLYVNPKIPRTLYGDGGKLHQVILNLVTNAIKYTDFGWVKVTFQYQMIDDENINLFVSVRDTGRGIRKEDVKRLFNTFNGVDEKKNGNIEGTGHGLAISKNYVDMMKGEIGVESVYGRGSVFYIAIPQKIVDRKPIGKWEKRVEAKSKKAPDKKINNSSSDNSFGFLDKKIGMEYCGDDEEFYNDMLMSYARDNKIVQIQKCFEEKDYDNYRILVHALKGISLTIGAVSFYEKVKKLEEAAKEGNTNYIEMEHSGVMDEYRMIIDCLLTKGGEDA